MNNFEIGDIIDWAEVDTDRKTGAAVIRKFPCEGYDKCLHRDECSGYKAALMNSNFEYLGNNWCVGNSQKYIIKTNWEDKDG